MANMRTAAPVRQKLRHFGADAHGLAGIEFALTGLFLVAGLLNAVDVGYYIYRRMEVENAADSRAEAALKTCAATNPNDQSPMLPATQNCSGLTNPQLCAWCGHGAMDNTFVGNGPAFVKRTRSRSPTSCELRRP